MQCRDRHKSFVFNIRDACFIMKMKNVKKIDMNKKLYEQIKALLADKLDEKSSCSDTWNDRTHCYDIPS